MAAALLLSTGLTHAADQPSSTPSSPSSTDPAQQQSGLGSAGARGARWQQPTVTISVDPSVDGMGTTAYDAVVLAATTWQNAPGILPTLVVERGAEDDVGYHRNGTNHNTVRFAADGDPLANGALAITVITFDAHAKQILDADVILNGEHGFAFYDHDMRNQGMATYDVQNVLTHEFGHLLGLGEDYVDEDATMFAYSQPGEIGKRDLETVDKNSISTLYDKEFEPPAQAGCGGATIAGYEGGNWVWAALGLGTVGFLMRRRALRARSLALFALGAGLLGVGVSDSTPWAAGAARLATGTGSSTPMRVTSAESSWEGGLIVTRLGLRAGASGEGTPEVHVRALGGRVGDLVQVVGHALPPGLGQTLQIDLSALSGSDPLWLAPVLSVD